MQNYLWPWPIFSRSFSHDLALKLLKYGTSCRVCSTTCTVLVWFFPYLAHMITSMRGCVVHNDIWPWPISSRLFSCDFAYFMDCIFFSLICFYFFFIFMDNISMWHQYGPVTMIVPASGHQVRCIPWVQMGTFNKEIGFLCGLKFFALNIFCGEYLQSSLHLMLQIWWKPLLWKMCQ